MANLKDLASLSSSVPVTKPEEVTAVTPSEWSKRVTLTCVDGRWTAQFETKSGVPGVTPKDLIILLRTVKVKQREHARVSRLALLTKQRESNLVPQKV